MTPHPLNQPAPISRPLSFRLWLRSLRHRPFLWIALAIALGCALGPFWAANEASRAASILWLPLVVGSCFVVAAWRWRIKRPGLARVAWFCALVMMSTTHSARRLTPPANDVSSLVRGQPVPFGPQKPLAVPLRGWVADFPQRGDFAQEFPLECASLDSGKERVSLNGRVWVQAPLEAIVEVGDEVLLAAQLSDLPRRGNVGERTSPVRFVAQDCWCSARVRKAEELKVIKGRARYPLARWIDGLRARLLRHYEAAFEGGRGQTVRPYAHQTAQLLSAMVFGEGGLQEPLPTLTRDQFRAAGLSHLLVASGTQVAFLAGLLILTGRVLGLRRWPLLVLVLPALLVYALLAGGGASIWRATLGGGCLALALLLGRDVDGLSLWSLAVAVLLLLDPTQLWSLSFQLTFAATWGLIALAPPIGHFLDKRCGRTPLNQLVSLSLGAQLATMPLLLFHFGRLSAAGIGANFLALPLVGVLVYAGVIGLVFPPANWLNYLLTNGIARIAVFASQAPGAQVETVPVRPQWMLLLFAFLLLLAALPANETGWTWREEVVRWWRDWREEQQKQWRSGRRRWQSAFVAGALLLSSFVAWKTFSRPTLLRVCVLDVGQGESIVITSPSGRAVLVDGGTLAAQGRGEAGRSIIVPYLQSIGVNHLDALVATHDDADHLSALPAVLREVPVETFLDGAFPSNGLGSPEYQDVLQAAKQTGAKHYMARAGQRLELGDGARLTVLAPLEPKFAGGKNDNNNGIVMRLDYGKTSILLTADIEREAEERLVRRGANLHCTILKLAHHGSRTSTGKLFLNAANPRAAVLSCGRYNSFGHPTPAVLERLQVRRIPVFRTDRDGSVEISCDGNECWVQPFR